MIESVPLLVVLAVLATARLTRLLTADKIVEPLRKRAELRFGPPERSKFMYLITCDWCASFWIAIPVAAATLMAGDRLAVQAGLLALAASQITGMFAANELA
jgi:hypothetical protein